jgi:hypothetical protein
LDTFTLTVKTGAQLQGSLEKLLESYRPSQRVKLVATESLEKSHIKAYIRKQSLLHQVSLLTLRVRSLSQKEYSQVTKLPFKRVIVQTYFDPVHYQAPMSQGGRPLNAETYKTEFVSKHYDTTYRQPVVIEL